jgi:hypothetical protein
MVRQPPGFTTMEAMAVGATLPACGAAAPLAAADAAGDAGRSGHKDNSLCECVRVGGCNERRWLQQVLSRLSQQCTHE